MLNALLMAACLVAGAYILLRRPLSFPHCTPERVAQMMAENLFVMRSGSALHVRHDHLPGFEFHFLKRRDTGGTQQDVIFAVVEESGNETHFNQVVEAVRSARIPMEVVTHMAATGEVVRVLKVFLYGTAESLRVDAERMVRGVVSAGGGDEGATFTVFARGAPDPAIRRRLALACPSSEYR